MSAAPHTDLSAELGRIGALLRAALAAQLDDADERTAAGKHLAQCEAALAAIPRAERPGAWLAARLDLTGFERDALLVAAGCALNADIQRLVAALTRDSRQTQPSVAVALAALPEPDMAAFAPDRPLRRLHLLTPGESGLTTAPLRLDERVLHALLGIATMDTRVLALVCEVEPSPRLPRCLAEAAAALALRAGEDGVPTLHGAATEDRRQVAAAAARQRRRSLWRLAADDLPAAPDARVGLAALWERELRLLDAALLIELDAVDDPVLLARVRRFAEAVPGLVLVSAPRRPALEGVAVEVPRPSREEQAEIWRRALAGGARRVNGAIEQVTAQFDLPASAIEQAAASALAVADRRKPDLWTACREHLRLRLDDLASHLRPVADWDDLVLPAEQTAILKGMLAQVRHRNRVYEDWGFAARLGRGLGISALFAGPSGTGKTMAAEVIARSLDLDLYRIDLSAVVSKYIGETEKNLRRVFDAADGSGALLVFDEADALFGKRTEVRDSHDRFANIEISYLLQRMEDYAGLAILTTNRRAALDEAFLRRIRFIVQFPFPDRALRVQLWQKAFPAQVRTEGLLPERLAQLDVAPGTIRNIALNAAFLAAAANAPVTMRHLLDAATVECGKLEKALTPVEIGGWL